MAVDAQVADLYLAEMKKMHEDAKYSAQTYFEAAKAADWLGRIIVFVPALVGALAGVLVALDASKHWGAVSAFASAIAATAAFLGSNRNVASFKNSALEFTQFRHLVSTEIALAARKNSERELEDLLRSLRDKYDSIVSKTEPAPNRSFAKARKRIGGGVLEYE